MQTSIHWNIGIDPCNADTDHVAPQPTIDQGMEINSLSGSSREGKKNVPDGSRPTDGTVVGEGGGVGV